jgi:dihydropyrimidinase
MSTLVIRGGHIVTDDGTEFDGDVVVRAGVIEMITDDPAVCTFYESHAAATTRVIDARGKLVVPGGVDPHVHLEYPQGASRIVSSDDFHTGSVAAAAGGTTTLLDFVEAAPDEPLLHALAGRRAAAEARSVLDFSFHMSVNRADEGTLAELRAVAAAGVTSFKIYTAYDGIRLTDSQLIAALKAMRGFGLPIVHAENHDLIMARIAECKAAERHDPCWHPTTRPVQGEAEATHRVAMLAEAVGMPAGVHIVHVTAEIALPTFRLAAARPRANGMGPVTGEVCAHHLALTEEVYHHGTDSADFVCAPPLRPASDVDAMWQALADRTLSFVVTDHCAFTRAQRRGERRAAEFRKHWDVMGEHIKPSSSDTGSDELEKWWKGPSH